MTARQNNEFLSWWYRRIYFVFVMSCHDKYFKQWKHFRSSLLLSTSSSMRQRQYITVTLRCLVIKGHFKCKTLFQIVMVILLVYLQTLKSNCSVMKYISYLFILWSYVDVHETSILVCFKMDKINVVFIKRYNIT